MPTFDLRLGDCLDVMRGMPDASMDAVVTDPPAGIAFMEKEWDRAKGRTAFIDFLMPRLAEARRLAKPGAYILCWAIPRTSHWTGAAIEDAGWVVRDRISHLFGTGFPKSKACLKPACEDWWLAWNPAKRITPLNVDACRIPTDDRLGGGMVSTKTEGWDRPWKHDPEAVVKCKERLSANTARAETLGRWPANVTHDGSDEVMDAFAAFGERPPGGWPAKRGAGGISTTGHKGHSTGVRAESSSTTADRFFYCAKASKSDRNEGLDGMPEQASGVMQDDSYRWKYDGKGNKINLATRSANHHPTVKSTALMRWLCRLITPPGGLVLDPFAGSGSTGKACALERFGFVGIEQSPEYHAIASARIAAAQASTVSA